MTFGFSAVIRSFLLPANTGLEGSFAQAASFVFSAAATRTRIVSAGFGHSLGDCGPAGRGLPFKGFLAPQGG